MQVLIDKISLQPNIASNLFGESFVKILKKPLVLSSLLLVAACATPLKITEPPTKASHKSALTEERISGDNTIVVRAYTGTGKERVEVAGALCKLDSLEVYASITTPAKVIMPTFRQRKGFANRGRPSDLQVICKYNGETGIQSFVAKEKEITTATNAGLAGAIFTTVISGAIASLTPWAYPEAISIDMD